MPGARLRIAPAAGSAPLPTPDGRPIDGHWPFDNWRAQALRNISNREIHALPPGNESAPETHPRERVNGCRCARESENSCDHPPFAAPSTSQTGNPADWFVRERHNGPFPRVKTLPAPPPHNPPPRDPGCPSAKKRAAPKYKNKTGSSPAGSRASPAQREIAPHHPG